MRFDSVPHELLVRCQKGNLDAFEELCACVQDDLYAFILSILRNHDDAADVHQECLVRMFKGLPKLRELSKFPGWIMRTAVNQCNTLRSSRNARVISLDCDETREAADLEPMFTKAAASPREVSAAHELQDHLNAAIENLPPKQKSAILLYEVEQLTVREISDLLECSEGVVKFNLFEARKKLRAALSKIEPSFAAIEASGQ